MSSAHFVHWGLPPCRTYGGAKYQPPVRTIIVAVIHIPIFRWVLLEISVVRRDLCHFVTPRHAEYRGVAIYAPTPNSCPSERAEFAQYCRAAELTQRRSVLLNANASGISCPPAVGPVLLAHTGPRLADTVNHYHTAQLVRACVIMPC